VLPGPMAVCYCNSLTVADINGGAADATALMMF